MKKKILLALFMIFTLILSACGDSDNDETKEEDNIVPVETTEVDKGNLKSQKSLYGQTQPNKQTPVMLEMPGELIELKVSNGDKVEKGDALAVVEVTVEKPVEQPEEEPEEEPEDPTEDPTQDPTEEDQAPVPEAPQQPAPVEMTEEQEEKTIESPSDGTVASLSSSTGAVVSNEEPLAMIINVDNIKIEATMTQKMRDLFKVDQEVEVEIDNEEYTGKVLALDPLPNENGELVINIRVENEDEKITTGESAKITVNKTLEKDVLIVPTEAVMTTEEESFVYIVKDSKAKKIVVDLLESQTKKTAIKGDIKEKDEVVVNGQTLLSDDVEVDVKKDGDNS